MRLMQKEEVMKPSIVAGWSTTLPFAGMGRTALLMLSHNGFS
jgi:hypothetical protein